MKVECKIYDEKLIFENNKWSTNSEIIAETVLALNRDIELREDEFPGDWHPNPEIFIAKLLLNPYKGKVLTEWQPRKVKPGVVY